MYFLAFLFERCVILHVEQHRHVEAQKHRNTATQTHRHTATHTHTLTHTESNPVRLCFRVSVFSLHFLKKNARRHTQTHKDAHTHRHEQRGTDTRRERERETHRHGHEADVACGPRKMQSHHTIWVDFPRFCQIFPLTSVRFIFHLLLIFQSDFILVLFRKYYQHI